MEGMYKNIGGVKRRIDMIERLTEKGVDGIRAFCFGCSDKPLIGKCDIGSECYHRQVFKALQNYEDTGLSPEEITRLQSELFTQTEMVERAEKRAAAAIGAIRSVCNHCGFNNNPCTEVGCFAHEWRGENKGEAKEE
jgi:predicted Zn-ribbon and HTH transcriptional regulator